jgi:hypothetical protein
LEASATEVSATMIIATIITSISVKPARGSRVGGAFMGRGSGS